MPSIQLMISGEEDHALAKKLAKEITRLTKELLGKKPELTAVIVSFLPQHLWFIDSVSLDELKTKSFHLHIKVTDSTNIKIDKANYIAAVHHSLTEILGTIHPVSYTAIQEMKADSYGYEGSTLEYKYIQNQNKLL